MKGRTFFVAMAVLSLFPIATRQNVASAASVRVIKDVLYASPGGQNLYVDIYQPSGTGPFAGILVIHGGGWQFNDRTAMAGEAMHLAEQGLVAFSIDYRLANRKDPSYSPWPAQVEDCQTAVRWVRSHAGQYRVDPHRIGALGASAGGHLAALLGVMGSGSLDQGSRVRVVVAWSGPMDMAALLRARLGPSIHEKRVERALINLFNCPNGPLSCSPQLLQEASPITYVDSSDAAMFFTVGAQEPVVPTVAVTPMDAALSRAGVPHRMVVVPGPFHAQAQETKPAPSLAGQDVLDASMAWLETWVNRGRSASSGHTGKPGQPIPGSAGSRTPLAIGLLVALVAVVVIALVVALPRLGRKRPR